MRHFLFLLYFFIPISIDVMAQNLSADDETLYRTAFDLFDHGEENKAINLYKEILTRAPNEYKVGFELGYSYAMTGECEKAVEILRNFESHKDVTDDLFTTEAFCLGKLGSMEEAEQTLERGFVIFPKSGRLCRNMGELSRMKGDLAAASNYFRRGIELDPGYIDNYYYASLYYCDMESYLFALMSGEIYCLSQPASENYSQLGRLLANINGACFRSLAESPETKIDSESLFVKLVRDYKMDENLYKKLTDDGGSEKIHNLTSVRAALLEYSLKRLSDVDKLPALMQFQKKILDAGHWEAYNMWLFYPGGTDEFERWLVTHRDTFSAFADWFNQNAYQLGGIL